MMLVLTSAAILFSAQLRPPPAPEEVPRLIARIKASYDAESSSAVARLGQVGRPAVPALIEVLRDRTLPSLAGVKQPARYSAALALSSIGTAAEEAVPALLVVLRDRSEDEGVRWACALALGSIGRRPDEVVPALMAVLQEPGSSGSSLGWYVVGALAQLSEQPAARPALMSALPALKRAHAGMGGSGGFAAIFRALEPPSPARLADEDDVRAAVIRRKLVAAREAWCLDERVSDAVFKRLTGFKVTRSWDECSEPQPTPEPSPLPVAEPEKGVVYGIEVVPRRYRHLIVESIDWLSNDRVHTTTTACFGYLPCPQTVYELERRKGRWIVVSEEHPPAL